MVRRRSSVFSIAVALALLGACTSNGGGGDSTPEPPGGPRPFKIMTFNIEYGGDGVSFDKVVEAIRLADPDVVGVNEPGKNLPKLAEALGWDNYDEQRQLIAQHPIRLPADDDPRYAYIEIAPDRYVAVADTHLPSAPYGPNIIERKDYTLDQVLAVEKKNRIPEATLVMDNLEWNAQQGVPSFMIGDFNTPSHRDWTEEMVGARPQIDYAVEWPVTKMLEDHGFTDSYRAIYPDPATDPGLTWPAARPKIKGEWNPGPDTLADRIDMIFSAGPAEATDSWIMGEEGADVKETVTPWPSDHRALISTFDVEPAPITDPRPFVKADPALATTGKPLTVTFFSPDPNATIFVEPEGAGTEDPSTAEMPASEGKPVEGFAPAESVDFDTKGWPAEAHDVVLAAADGEELARTTFWVKHPGDKVQVGTTKKAYGKGAPITVTWYGAPANRWDWVGIYERGGDPQTDWYILWAYTNATVAGDYTFGRADAGPWPLDPGEYTVYYLLNDGYKQIAGGDFRIK